MTDQEYQTLLNHANNWRYLNILKSQGMSKDELWQHNKRTTKGDLDAWLMSRFGLDNYEARMISNYSMEQDDYRVSRDSVRWVAKRPAPTFEDYPEFAQ